QARSSGDHADQRTLRPAGSPCSRWLAILPRGRKIPDRRFDSDRVLGGRVGGKLVIGEKVSSTSWRAPQQPADRPWAPPRCPFLPRAAARAVISRFSEQRPTHVSPTLVGSGLDGLQVACYSRFGGRPCLSKERCRL